MTTKQALRKTIQAQRKALSNTHVEEHSHQIIQQLTQWSSFKEAASIALYHALPGEVNLTPFFPICWGLNKQTSIPVFDPKTQNYQWAAVSAQTPYITGNYGIQEPQSPELIPATSIDLIVVPAVAYDARGNRLGRGGGYYDHLLSHFTGPTLGVCFDFQYIDQVPTEPHDCPVQHVITEKKIVNVQKEH